MFSCALAGFSGNNGQSSPFRKRDCWCALLTEAHNVSASQPHHQEKRQKGREGKSSDKNSQAFQFSILRCGSNLSVPSLWSTDSDQWCQNPENGEMEKCSQWKNTGLSAGNPMLELRRPACLAGPETPSWLNPHPLLLPSPYTDTSKHNFHSSTWGNKKLRKNMDLAITFLQS